LWGVEEQERACAWASQVRTQSYSNVLKCSGLSRSVFGERRLCQCELLQFQQLAVEFLLLVPGKSDVDLSL